MRFPLKEEVNEPMDLETLGTSSVKNLIAKTSRLKSFINERDTEPLFDGAIYVFSNNRKNNESYEGRIPVQVKAKISKNFLHGSAKYRVSKDMLNAYLKEGGIAFFLVLVSSDGESCEVFYNNLLPFKINRILTTLKRNSIQLQFQRFPTNVEEIVDWSLNYLRDSVKQAMLRQPKLREILSHEDLAKSGKIQQYNFGFTSVQNYSLFDYLLKGEEMHVYAELESGIEVPIQIMEKGGRIISTELEMEIGVADKVFYNSARAELMVESKTLFFGKGISFAVPQDNQAMPKLKLNYKFAGNLSEWIHDAEFISELSKEGKMKMDGHEITLDAGFDFSHIEKLLAQLHSIKLTLDAAGVNMDLNFESMSDDDFSWINLLNNALVKNKEISLNTNTPMQVNHIVISFIKIANLSICLFILKTSPNGYRVYNPFHNGIDYSASIKDENGEVHEISRFHLFSDEYFSSMSNLNLDVIYEDIVSKGCNIYNFQESNRLALCLLSAYDSMEKKIPNFLEFAKKLIKWESNNNADKNSVDAIYSELNLLQTIKRERAFEPEEIMRLHEISQQYNNDSRILTGVQILIGNYPLAKFHYNQICSEDKKAFAASPIINLWEDFECENLTIVKHVETPKNTPL